MIYAKFLFTFTNISDKQDTAVKAANRPTLSNT